MSNEFEDLVKRIRALNADEKTAIVRELIDELDPAQDPHVERLWLQEAERRYARYRRGD